MTGRRKVVRPTPSRRAVLGLLAGGWLVGAATPRALRAATAAAGVADGAGLTQLRAFLREARSARGTFSQRTVGRSRTAQSSSGTFEFQRPGRFRWIYQAPYEQVIVSDGQKVYLFDKDLNQVTVRKVEASLPASPATILFGGSDFERDFDASEQGVKDGVAWVGLKPRSTGGTFDRIDIGLRDGLPAAMRLADSFGQTTDLAFTRFERNPTLDPALFRFSAPAGAEVLEDR
jgi:outer membrane lipoprotein carrier protein